MLIPLLFQLISKPLTQLLRFPLNIITSSQRPHLQPPNQITLGIRTHTYKLWGHKHMPIAVNITDHGRRSAWTSDNIHSNGGTSFQSGGWLGLPKETAFEGHGSRRVSHDPRKECFQGKSLEKKLRVVERVWYLQQRKKPRSTQVWIQYRNGPGKGKKMSYGQTLQCLIGWIDQFSVVATHVRAKQVKMRKGSLGSWLYAFSPRSVVPSLWGLWQSKSITVRVCDNSPCGGQKRGSIWLSFISLSRVPPMIEFSPPRSYLVKTLLPGEQTFNTLGLCRTLEIETMALAKWRM